MKMGCFAPEVATKSKSNTLCIKKFLKLSRFYERYCTHCKNKSAKMSYCGSTMIRVQKVVVNSKIGGDSGAAD